MTISIGIITRFRHKLLDKCLKSISKQTILPVDIIIVLHPQDQYSIDITNKYSKAVNIRRHFYSKKGYASQRNTLLKKCKNNILYMVDDDCILGRNNIKNILNIFKKNPQISAIQGKAVNKDTGFYSQFMQWTYNLWIKRLDAGHNNLYSIDTKNIAFRMSKVSKAIKHKFNECFGSEDVDFGLQLNSSSLKIYYSNNVVVSHNESTDTLFNFLLKKSRMKRGISFIKQKWKNDKIHAFSRQESNYLLNIFNKSPYATKWKYKIIFYTLSFIRKLG
jgi:GT2 family glycosyltransferase